MLVENLLGKGIKNTVLFRFQGNKKIIKLFGDGSRVTKSHPYEGMG